jgi:hypothetical protein
MDPAALASVLDLVPDALGWAESWLAAGPWHEGERARTLAGYQGRMIEAAFAAAGKIGGPAVALAAGRLVGRLVAAGEPLRPPLLGVCGSVFRGLRRLGLHGEAEVLVRHLDAGPDAPATPATLGLAAGWYAVGHEDEGNRHVDRARELLFYHPDGLTDADRTGVAIAYAEALGFAPPQLAHGRLEEVFHRLRGVKVEGATNRYYTLRPLQLVDTVVRSVVTDDFALGPSVRGWLDDDEFLIRGRIHRDLAAVLREQGLA